MIASNAYPTPSTVTGGGGEEGGRGDMRGGQVSMEEVNMLRCRALLSFAYVYQETR
jgi:hypothetical protein